MYQVDINDVIRNYDFEDKDPFLYCLFEAVSNALYCCADNQDIKITIKLTREYKTNELIKDNDNFITAFKITDNGTGFTNDNFDKFAKKMFKTNHEGGKGLGRISFIKVFNNVHIESCFEEKGKYYSRNFKFSTDDIVGTKKEAPDKTSPETTVYFSGIKSDFRDNTKKSIEYYSDEILNHFYIFLHFLLKQKKDFEIMLIDDSGKVSDEVINTAKLKTDKVKNDHFIIHDPAAFEGIGNVMFDIIHIKTKNISGNKAFYVVDERSAGEIKKLNLPPYILKDKEGNDFYYYVYLKSDFFRKFLNGSRTKLSIPSESKGTNKVIVSEEKILSRFQEKIDAFLEYELSVLEKKIEQKIGNALTDDKNNRTSNNKSYLYILADDETKKEFLSKIKFNDTDQVIINKIKNFHEELQIKTIGQINSVVEKLKNNKKTENAVIDYEKLQSDMESLIQKVNIENSVNLASYIMYRKYILDLFHEGLEYYKTSKEYNESFFHNILMQKGSHNAVDSNLWMLDELFLFFEGTSEQPIQSIEFKGQKIIRELTEEETEMLNQFDRKRMENRIDLLFFPEERQCITIELKDPKIKVREGVPQMDEYVKILANFIKPEFHIEFFYTYLITDNFNKYDIPSGEFRKIYGIEGFVRHSANITSYDTHMTIANQYSEIIRYTDIYERAHKRNKIFMQKLNIAEPHTVP